MTVSKETGDVLKRLAESMLIEEAASLGELSLTAGFKQGRIPNRLREAAGGEEAILMAGDDLRLYQEVVARLAAEKELEHITPKDVDTELWDFVCDLFVNKKEYQSSDALSDAIRNFLKKVVKPWQDYEVMAVIENLKLKVQELPVVGVRITRLTKEKADDWGLADAPAFKDNFPDVIDKHVAVAEERAGSSNRAAERAVNKIDDALDALRTAVAGSILVARIDEQLLFARGTFLAVRDMRTKRVVSLQWHRPFRPVEFEIGSETLDPATQYLSSINALIESGTPVKLVNLFYRAMHWIGRSLTRESLDDKIVDLCTAMETLLCTRSDRLKGEAIAIRYMLLSTATEGGFTNPFELLRLYALRSKIIHGSDIRVCSRRDYDHLRWIATTVLRQYATFVRDTGVRSYGKFIAALETHDDLANTICWLVSRGVRPDSPLIASALAGLKRIHGRYTRHVPFATAGTKVSSSGAGNAIVRPCSAER